jgi:hypothetical protein
VPIRGRFAYDLPRAVSNIAGAANPIGARIDRRNATLRSRMALGAGLRLAREIF